MIVLFQTPITCDQTNFTLRVVATGTTSSGSLAGTPLCAHDSSIPSVNLTFAFPSPLSFTSTSSVSLQATSVVGSSVYGSPLFTHGVLYEIALENYYGICTQISETLTNDPTNQLTGDVVISLSAVPTELLDESGETLRTGNIFSYFSSSAPALSMPTSATLTVSFELPAPGYFYHVSQVQAISALQFVVGLVSLAGGVMAVGSYLFRIQKLKKDDTKIDTPMSSL